MVMKSDILLARKYLETNVELRETLGIEADEVLEPRPLGMGEHNLNYLFDDVSTGRTFVLRINVVPQPFHDNQVAYEFDALAALAPSGRVPEPLYLDDSDSAPAKGALVIGFREGDMLDFDHVRPGDLRCAAQIMADVHAVPVSSEARAALYKPLDPLRALFEECVERFEVYYGSAYEDERITKWARRFIDAAEKATHVASSAGDGAHIVNTETLPSHFLIPAASAAAAAANCETSGPYCADPGSFVDWERPVIGEVAQDVAYFVSPTTTFWDSDFLFPPDDIDAFVDDYWRAVDGRFERGGFDERFRAWRMMTALRSTTWCCRALVAYNVAGAHKTQRTIEKLPVYLSDDFMVMLAEDVFGL